MAMHIEDKNALKVLGVVFKKYRENSGYSLRGVSRSVNVSHTVISEIENGKIHPNIQTLKDLYGALELSICTKKEVIEEMQKHLSQLIHQIYFMQFSSAQTYFDVLKTNENVLLHSPLRVDYLLTRALFLSCMGENDSDVVFDELNDIYDFMNDRQRQLYHFLIGYIAFKKQNIISSINALKQGLTFKSNEKLDAMTQYYLAVTYHRIFQNHMSIHFCEESSKLFAKHNNIKRKIEMDLLRAHKMIDIGQFSEADDLLLSLRQALRMTYGEKTMRQRIEMYKAYLHFSKRENNQTLKYLSFETDDPNYRYQLYLGAMVYFRKDKKERTVRLLKELADTRVKEEPLNKLSVISNLFLNYLGEPMDETVLEKSIETFLRMPYGFPTIHLYYLTIDLIIYYVENHKDFEKAMWMAKRIHEINKKRELNDTHT